MKGHMEKDGFHPHTQYKGVRKSRDQQAKEQGVRFKKEQKVPRNTEVIKVKGTKKEIVKKLMETKQWNGFENISDDGWFSGSIYLDNGEGRSDYAVYRGLVSDGQVEVKMNKNDVPSYWRDLYYDDLFMEATDKVKDIFEEMMTERKKRYAKATLEVSEQIELLESAGSTTAKNTKLIRDGAKDEITKQLLLELNGTYFDRISEVRQKVLDEMDQGNRIDPSEVVSALASGDRFNFQIDQTLTSDNIDPVFRGEIKRRINDSQQDLRIIKEQSR